MGEVKMSERTVGLVGIGLMGEALARRLIPAGFTVVGVDVDEAKNRRLVELGGKAASITDIARTCKAIVLAVFSTDQVEEVTDALLKHAATGRIVMCTSTCNPDRIATLAARVAPRGLRFLETPVSGSSDQVRRGEGVGLIGGDPQVAAEVAPILDALFPNRFHIGKPGDGGRAKLAINLILGLNRLALAEGLVFASRLGLDPDAFLKVARASAASSQVMDTKGPKMVSRDFAPQGYVHQTLKDVHMMLDQAQQRGQELPALRVNADVLEACVRHGEAELDNSIVIEEIRRRTKGH